MAFGQKAPDRVRRSAVYRRSRQQSQPPRSSPPSRLARVTMASLLNKPEALTEPDVPGARPEFYTREAAARRLGVGKTTVWELTSRGEIGVAYIGSKPLIPAVELERYIAKLIQEARERAEAWYRPKRGGR